MMNMLTKYLKYMFIMVALVLILTGCELSTKKDEKIMKLLAESTNLTYAESYRIDYELEGIDKKNIVWESSNSDLVSVDKNGNLFVKQNIAAEVVIVAKDGDGKILSKFVVNVDVSDNVVPVMGVSLNKELIDLQYGDEFQATAIVTPTNASNSNVIWTSSDSTLVKVDNKGTAEWEISQSNAKMITFARNYNNVIQTKKDAGYSVQGYVVSMHPVRVSQSDSDTVVVNSNPNSCSKTYRSNWKYYKFNIAMKWIIINNGWDKNLR